jgi:hypothetical protein
MESFDHIAPLAPTSLKTTQAENQDAKKQTHKSFIIL